MSLNWTLLQPDSTAADIEEEIDFTQILISTLDPDSEDYVRERKELDERMQYLQGRFQSALDSPNANLRNQALNDSTMTAAPAQQAQQLASHALGTKRPLPHSLLAQDRPYKRHTPSPLSYDGGSATLEAERTRRRQLEAEAHIKRHWEQRKQDEDYARRLSQQPSSMLAGPSSQPAYQATLEQGAVLAARSKALPDQSRSLAPQSVYHAQGNTNTPSQIKAEHQRPLTIQHRPSQSSTDFVDLTADSDDEYPFANLLSVAPTQTAPAMMPARPYAMPMPAQPVLPGLHSTYMQQQQQQQQMPGAWPGNQSQYGQLSPSIVLPQQQMPTASSSTVPSNHYLARAQGLGMHALQHVQHVNTAFNSHMSQLNELINGTQHNPYYLDDMDDDYDSDVYAYEENGERYSYRLTDTMTQPPTYANHKDLYRSRYEEIESHNPEKNRAEINALLLNIRPDEELPDHLLITTPEAMSIKLHKYQELGLTWLQKAEEGTNKGGILADDMGLGKTIQMLSLIVTRKSQDSNCKTTLIVAPVALLRQWKQEIERRIKPGRHALKVYIHHGSAKKSQFRDLQQYDIVLTTYGSLAAELKRYEKFALRRKFDSMARPTKHEQCTLIDPDCKWYRVILDEAQCIKNKMTQTAKAAFMLRATHRFCMTGTPMMNNVNELYSLINFLRIAPYNRWEKFRVDFTQPLKSTRDEPRSAAMHKLQVLCKAIMLRRTKKSMYQGQPILILPDRTTEIDHAVFDEDEKSIYDALEQRSQVTFNKYLRAGTVGRSYSAILVLLLRLRQACCHPHLIKDFSIAAAADLSVDDLLELAKELPEQAVNRIKATDGNFECPICMDACLNPAIFIPCGHDTCRDCYVKLADPSNALREGNENGGKARCPHCRGDIDPKRITDFTSFKRAYMPELLTEEEKTIFGLDDDADDDSSDDDSDVDDSETESETGDKTLGGFIINDEAEDDDETESEAEEADAGEEIANLAGASDMLKDTTKNKNKSKSKKKAKPKSKKSKKAKGKAKAKPRVTLAELKKRANTSIGARRKYLRRLQEDYTDSGKIRKMMELLGDIIDGNDGDPIQGKKPTLPSGEKVLVFSQWTSLLDLCEIEIDRKNWDYRRYDGSMNAKMRADAVDDFKDTQKDVRIMLVSLKAGNAGLNLNIASQVIILDPFWNPYIEEQAIDRAHRIGQTRPVKVHRVLVQDTVEDRIIALQEGKRKLIEQALDEKQASQLSRLGAQELAYLFGVTRSVNEGLPQPGAA